VIRIAAVLLLFTLPSPACDGDSPIFAPTQYMAALKPGNPNWQTLYRPPIPTNFSSRTQTALNLGGLVADYYLAVEAEDAQQVRNIGKDIVAMAKGLGISESMIVRGQSLSDFAERGEWSTLRQELDAMRRDVRSSLEAQQDDALVPLVAVGMWIRSAEIASDWVAENYTPEAADPLRQWPLITEHLAELPPKIKEDPMVARLIVQLLEQAPVIFPSDQPLTVDEVKGIQEAAGLLMKTITTKNGDGNH